MRRDKLGHLGKVGATALVAIAAVALVSTRAWARPAVGGTAPASAPARAFLRVELRAGSPAPRVLYVGQTVPVTIRAYFLDGTGVSLTGEPHLVSDGLTLSELSDKPTQTETQVRGLPYTVLTWTGRVTAARDGAARTDVELPVELSYREAPRAPTWPSAGADEGADERSDDQTGAGGGDDSAGDANDPFSAFLKQTPLANDPFFSQMFKGGDPFAGMMQNLAGTIRQRDVTLHGPGNAVRVLELPGPQPAGFTGAVGSFALTAALADGPYHVGEPATLRLSVKGQGSFARLALAGLPSSPSVTTYTPTVTSAPGAVGEKVFSQTVVPRRPGATTLPAVTLTYFDPHGRRYVTRRTEPIRIDVAAAPEDVAAGAAGRVGSTGAAETAASARAASGAVPDVVRQTLTPFVRTRRFPLVVGAIGLLTLALVVLGRLVRGGTLARRRAAVRLQRALAADERAVRQAADRGDPAALFGAGRRALQAKLSDKWGVPPEAIAAADVDHRLGPRGARIREIFERADRYSYAGAPTGADPDLERWPERISAELRNLESAT